MDDASTKASVNFSSSASESTRPTSPPMPKASSTPGKRYAMAGDLLDFSTRYRPAWLSWSTRAALPSSPSSDMQLLDLSFTSSTTLFSGFSVFREITIMLPWLRASGKSREHASNQISPAPPSA